MLPTQQPLWAIRGNPLFELSIGTIIASYIRFFNDFVDVYFEICYYKCIFYIYFFIEQCGRVYTGIAWN